MPRRQEYRIRTQVDYDHYEAFDRTRYGLPRVNWVYAHRETLHKKGEPVDLYAPYADPITGGMRQMTFDYEEKSKVASQAKHLQLEKERHARAKEVYRKEKAARMEEFLATAPRLLSDEEIEARHVPESLMVNRQIYLGHIRSLMIELGIKGDEDFELHKGKLVRHALYRMGKLP